MSSHKGFTLIEVLVAAAIFGTLMVAVTGLFVSALRVERNILASKKVLGQISYATEYMTRALRMAEKDKTGSCVQDVPVGSGNYSNYEITANGIKFINALQNSECHEFLLEGGQIKMQTPAGKLALTSTGITVDFLEFELSGETQSDNLQPFVTIYIEAHTKESPALEVQTSVSQRNLDVTY